MLNCHIISSGECYDETLKYKAWCTDPAGESGRHGCCADGLNWLVGWVWVSTGAGRVGEEVKCELVIVRWGWEEWAQNMAGKEYQILGGRWDTCVPHITLNWRPNARSIWIELPLVATTSQARDPRHQIWLWPNAWPLKKKSKKIWMALSSQGFVIFKFACASLPELTHSLLRPKGSAPPILP